MNKSEIKLLSILLIWELWTVHQSPWDLTLVVSRSSLLSTIQLLWNVQTAKLKVLILTAELDIDNWSQVVVWQKAKKTILKVIFMNMLMKRLHRD